MRVIMLLARLRLWSCVNRYSPQMRWILSESEVRLRARVSECSCLTICVIFTIQILIIELLYELAMRISSLREESQLQNIIPSYKIIILGVGKAGKSKLLTRYIYGSFEDSRVPTFGIDCSYHKTKQARFAYFDTAGQERYRTILNMYFKGSDAAILVYSVDDQESFREMDYYKGKIDEQEPQCQLYIIGCKGDLKATVKPSAVEEKYPLLKHFLTSAKTGQGVREAFRVIECELLKHRKKGKSILSRPLQPFSAINTNTNDKDKNIRKRCC